MIADADEWIKALRAFKEATTNQGGTLLAVIIDGPSWRRIGRKVVAKYPLEDQTNHLTEMQIYGVKIGYAENIWSIPWSTYAGRETKPSSMSISMEPKPKHE